MLDVRLPDILRDLHADGGLDWVVEREATSVGRSTSRPAVGGHDLLRRSPLSGCHLRVVDRCIRPLVSHDLPHAVGVILVEFLPRCCAVVTFLVELVDSLHTTCPLIVEHMPTLAETRSLLTQPRLSGC